MLLKVMPLHSLPTACSGASQDVTIIEASPAPLPPPFHDVLVWRQSAAGEITGDKPSADSENGSTKHGSH